MTNRLKRSQDFTEDIVQTVTSKKPADVDRSDPLNNEAVLSWPEVFSSILRPRSPSLLETVDVDLVEKDTVATVFASIPSLDHDIVEVSAEIADVSQLIQKWTDNHVFTTEEIKSAEAPVLHEATSCLSQAPQRASKCFGTISAARARLTGDMRRLHAKLAGLDSYVQTLSMQVVLTYHFFSLLTTDGLVVGQLTDTLTKSLAQIIRLPSVEIEAFTNLKNTLRRINKAKNLQESVIEVDINIYGSSEVREKVGRIFSEDKLYLQNPRFRINDFEHDNPHMITFQDITVPDHSNEVHGLVEISKASATMKTVQEVRQYETKNRGLVGLKRDIRIKTDLLPHQEEALEFMVQREIGPISPDFQLWRLASEPEGGRVGFRHKVTGCWTAQPLPETGGGILADDMGMGKTLSTLSLITHRLSDGLEWSHSKDDGDYLNATSHLSSRATLVVVSSLLIMNGWLKDIEDHLDGSLKVLKYHGKGRETDVTNVADSDIVLTTYHTLAAERKTKRAPITSIRWFRIVLDEAHTIRRQATSLFTAASELDSCHRWCLSGTPIQNRLDDLGALLAFLRFDPFDKTSMFRKYVILPVSSDLAEAKNRLMTLLDSVCLRRSIERLHLQPLEHRVQKVNFSAPERAHYNKTLEFMQHAMSYGSREQFSKTPFGKFQIQLQLRILCNHGTFQRPYEWGRADTQTQREDAISSIGKHGEVTCSNCHQKTFVLKTNCAAAQTTGSSRSLLCDECLSQFAEGHSTEATTKNSNPNRKDNGLVNEPVTFPWVTRASTFDETGYSSKMDALIKDVSKDLTSTKSIIFSCWTRSLNLVKRHLDELMILYERIDGDTAMNQRQKILDQFSQSSKVRILLMTTGTGAYGLNLAVANRVFLLEPQWNPSIENQAIARVQRFLQKQKVQVIRYVVTGTVEDDILRQQQKKIKEAEMGFRSE